MTVQLPEQLQHRMAAAAATTADLPHFLFAVPAMELDWLISLDVDDDDLMCVRVWVCEDQKLILI